MAGGWQKAILSSGLSYMTAMTATKISKTIVLLQIKIMPMGDIDSLDVCGK